MRGVFPFSFQTLDALLQVPDLFHHLANLPMQLFLFVTRVLLAFHMLSLFPQLDGGFVETGCVQMLGSRVNMMQTLLEVLGSSPFCVLACGLLVGKQMVVPFVTLRRGIVGVLVSLLLMRMFLFRMHMPIIVVRMFMTLVRMLVISMGMTMSQLFLQVPRGSLDLLRFLVAAFAAQMFDLCAKLIQHPCRSFVVFALNLRVEIPAHPLRFVEPAGFGQFRDLPLQSFSDMVHLGLFADAELPLQFVCFASHRTSSLG
jgi:hypothetical protein